MLTLLLNSDYRCISFIHERKAIKLLIKGKVEILSNWEEKIKHGNGSISHPAVLRLKHRVRWIPRRLRFNKISVFRRDERTCQYCGKVLPLSELTIDHIIPRIKGGENSWKNCVAACKYCNNWKGDSSPEEAGLKLIKEPIIPKLTIFDDYKLINNKHGSWEDWIY